MKKYLKPSGSGGGPPPSQLPPSSESSKDTSPSSAPNSLQSFIGKSYRLPKHTLTIEEVLAEGGFGVVYLVKTSAPDKNKQLLALKRIVVNNDDDLQAADREIKIMSTLGNSHRNILPCLDSLKTCLSEDITELLCLMPLVKHTLHGRLQKAFQTKTAVEEKELYKVASDVVSGLSRLHHCTTPIIHRDLKVENILYDGEAYLICDFGSATARVWDPKVHSVTAIVEDLEKYTTLAYRAPEMVDLYSDRGTLNTKTDIWALGVLLFKTAYWTLPFGESLLQIQTGKYETPPQPSYSSVFSSFIRYLLSPSQTMRPDVWQVSELLHTTLLRVPNPVPNLSTSKPPPSIAEIDEAAKRIEISVEPTPTKKISEVSSVVLETSVTPRQRPKGLGGVLQPPKSPKIDRKVPPPTTTATTTQAAVGGVVAASAPATTSSPPPPPPPSQVPVDNSWNPFEPSFNSSNTTTTTSTTAVVETLNNDSSADPFANAPFDGFSYIPMMLHHHQTNNSHHPMGGPGGNSSSSSTADMFGSPAFVISPNNPFIEDYHTNYSFDDS